MYIWPEELSDNGMISIEHMMRMMKIAEKPIENAYKWVRKRHWQGAGKWEWRSKGLFFDMLLGVDAMCEVYECTVDLVGRTR